jgi:hypothetical protein
MGDQKHVWRIDGIEEGMARVEEDGERMISIPRYLLPAAAKAGQVLRVLRATPAKGERHSVSLTIVIDDEATTAELARSRKQTSSISSQSKRRDPGGDVAL